MLSYHGNVGTWAALGESLTPAEVFTRNFCSVPWKTNPRSCSTTGSASTTSCGSRLPALRLDVAAHPGDRARADRGLPSHLIRKFTWENASRLYTIRCRPTCNVIQRRSERLCHGDWPCKKLLWGIALCRFGARHRRNIYRGYWGAEHDCQSWVNATVTQSCTMIGGPRIGGVAVRYLRVRNTAGGGHDRVRQKESQLLSRPNS